LNPIEMAFSKLVALSRQAAERTILGLLRTIGRFAKAFSPRVQEFPAPCRLCSNMTGIRSKRRYRSFLVSMLLICISGLFASFYGEATSLYAEQWLTSALEARFERPAVDNWAAIRGVVVLGGQPTRLREALRLMRDHAHLRLVMSGPEDIEMTLLGNIDETLRARTEIEQASISTCGSAMFSAHLIAPGPGDRWLLVTSALHMPRAIGAFRKAGFPVEPWPVYEINAAPWNAVLHEWMGLAAYRLLGCSEAFLPAR
jgi:uncharacterized SAM-binding protein YcdF (DUF218 family)